MASAALKSVPKTPFEVRRDAGDSRPLSAVEKTALEFCRQRAEQGLPITQVDLTIAIGSQNWTGSTAAGLLNRLEEKGYIKRNFYQRGVQVCMTDTGACTAEPPSRATHWRLREQPVQTPTIQALRERHPKLTRIIEHEAAMSGKHMQEFLMDLVANGLELYLEKKENENA
jgi:predicted transcriptional regulator